MKKILWLIVLSAMIAIIFAPIYTSGNEDSQGIVDETTENKEVEISEREQEMYDEMMRVAYIEDRKEWFIEYKSLFDKYSDFLAEQDNIYKEYTKEEIDKLQRVVEAEATGGTFMDKVNVCVTIFNRIEDERFGETIDEVITSDQFQTLSDGRWKEVEVTEDTILACEYAYLFGMIEHDALFFDATNGDSWASRNLEEVEVEGDNEHRFYK